MKNDSIMTKRQNQSEISQKIVLFKMYKKNVYKCKW